MSDTPETQAESFEHDQQCSPVVDAEFAARLERERDEYKRRWQDWERWAKQVVSHFRRVPLDATTVGMRNTLTNWMQEMKDAK